MPECVIEGIPVNFPFEPYDVQKAYMQKVIKCLQDGTNGVLESPTGTGKTLSLLCSSLAWLLTRKAEVQAQIQKHTAEMKAFPGKNADELGFSPTITAAPAAVGNTNWGIPKIIYASRTHSQLTQAMQELKRTAYSFMRAVVLGSRDQMCIHPDVSKEIGNSNKTQLCKLKVQTKTCSFYFRVESKKDHPDVKGPTILDIEDLVKVGQKLKMCPYFASKELVADADITFMPYNYLLDPKARKANKIELNNAIVILDEAHNIEKICEEAASVQIRSSDIAMAMEDVTHIMKAFSADGESSEFSDEPKDFSLEDLALLKEMLMDLEKAIDNIVVPNRMEGATFPAAFVFELLEKANFTRGTSNGVISLLERLLQYLAVENQTSAFRKGGSFQILSDFLSVVYVNKEELAAKVHKSFKLHVQVEEIKQNNRPNTTKDTWLSKNQSSNAVTKLAKVINYWCFNPGFGMEQLLNTNARSIILTSGTLAPLRPLIAELAIPVAQHLENPHIVDRSQVYVKIIGSGPDREQLISNYANRDNPKYISSLGQTILNVSRIIPDGLLVFFPSYPLLNQCVNSWQASGLWSDISRYKPIFVEPRNKDDFTNAMEEFYRAIRESRGACFMAVCRGKVSEGLDFADRNGRAVIITGLPFPPLKDAKVILKKRYLDDNRTKENELLTGGAWYSLDATRAVNQAIGRVIRHRHDYGAILLCDARFENPSQVQQLSKWIRNHLGNSPKSSPFGPVVRELREFFRNAEKNMPKPKERTIESLVKESFEEAGIVTSPFFADPHTILESKLKKPVNKNINLKIEKTNSVESWSPEDYQAAAGRTFGGNKVPSAMDFMSRLNSDVTSIDFNNTNNVEDGLVKIHKRERTSPARNDSVMESRNSGGASLDSGKKKRFKLVSNSSVFSQTATQSAFDATPSTSRAAGSRSQADSSSIINSFSFVKKPQVISDETRKQAPEDRVEFLRILRSSLSPENFSAFTEALISYKRDSNFDSLMALLCDILGRPDLKYMLLGMRRFLKGEHKETFDQRISTLTS